MLDRQKKKVYIWENSVVSPKDTTAVSFEKIQGIVDYVWKSEGLMFPPQAMPIPKQKRGADATRLVLRFSELTLTWVILHEVSHSMSALYDGRSNHHGSLFVGMYCKLLARYLHLDLGMLINSAKRYGICVEINAIPVFL